MRKHLEAERELIESTIRDLIEVEEIGKVKEIFF